MDIGKKMIRKYLYILKYSDISSKSLKYSDWYDSMTINNKHIISITEDDEVIALLGFSLLQILESCDMIKSKLVIVSKDKKYYTLVEYIYNSDKNINKDTRIVEIMVNNKPQQYELHDIE